MKYKLFCGGFYYPQGGYDDFIGSFETIQECKDFVENSPETFEWSHIVENDKIIFLAVKLTFPEEQQRIWEKDV